MVQYNSRHTEAGIKWTGKKSYLLEDGEEVEDGRAEGSSPVEDGGQAAVPPTPGIAGTGSGFLWVQFYLPSGKSDPVMFG